MKQPTIRFLIPYFGRWPAWMPFFVETARWNPTIDWYFYTDCGPLTNCPSNVRVFSTTFPAYCEKVSNVLGVDFKPTSPYKLCDLKPAYGYLHQDDLKEIDFWAFGDIDVVLGDLRAYFTDERLAKKDVFSTHARRISGHMCLIRNKPELNELFMRIPNWKELFQKNRHLALDEGAFTRLFLRHKNLPAYVASILGCLTNRWYRRAEFLESYSTPNAKIPWHDGSKNFPTCWRWANGKLFNNRDGDRTFPYFHFFIWKRSWMGSETLAENRKNFPGEIKEFYVSNLGFSTEGVA